MVLVCVQQRTTQGMEAGNIPSSDAFWDMTLGPLEASSHLLTFVVFFDHYDADWLPRRDTDICRWMSRYSSQ